jgi:hypothetical protein
VENDYVEVKPTKKTNRKRNYRKNPKTPKPQNPVISDWQVGKIVNLNYNF